MECLLLSDKKEGTVDVFNNIDESQNHMLSKRRQGEKSTYSRIPFVYNSKQCKIIRSDRKDICGCLWIGVEGGKPYRGSQVNFQG